MEVYVWFLWLYRINLWSHFCEVLCGRWLPSLPNAAWEPRMPRAGAVSKLPGASVHVARNVLVVVESPTACIRSWSPLDGTQRNTLPEQYFCELATQSLHPWTRVMQCVSLSLSACVFAYPISIILIYLYIYLSSYSSTHCFLTLDAIGIESESPFMKIVECMHFITLTECFLHLNSVAIK